MLDISRPRSVVRIGCTERTDGMARISITADGAANVSGTIRGPFCSYSRTLPSNYPVSSGAADIVDPCYWSPWLPFRYEVRLEIALHSGEVSHHDFMWGIRWCVPHKQDLRLLAKRYVVRAVQAPHNGLDLHAMRSESTALLTDASDEALLDAASEIGVMVVVAGNLTSESYAVLNMFPAVHFVKDCATQNVQHDLLRVTSCPNEVPDSELLWMRAAEISAPANGSKPIFAVAASETTDVADMRRSCDRLQRTLSKYGQFAGYIIHAGDVN